MGATPVTKAPPKHSLSPNPGGLSRRPPSRPFRHQANVSRHPRRAVPSDPRCPLPWAQPRPGLSELPAQQVTPHHLGQQWPDGAALSFHPHPGRDSSPVTPSRADAPGLMCPSAPKGPISQYQRLPRALPRPAQRSEDGAWLATWAHGSAHSPSAGPPGAGGHGASTRGRPLNWGSSAAPVRWGSFLPRARVAPSLSPWGITPRGPHPLGFLCNGVAGPGLGRGKLGQVCPSCPSHCRGQILPWRGAEPREARGPGAGEASGRGVSVACA